MARANKCKICGDTNPFADWVGTNHNLCIGCCAARTNASATNLCIGDTPGAEQARTTSRIPGSSMLAMTALSVTAMAAIDDPGMWKTGRRR